MQRAAALLASFLSVAPVAWGQAVRVDAVQAPAWLERSGRTVPLSAGVALQPQDRILTGANARVRMLLAEGSAVRLGEHAVFTLERAEDRAVFRAALDVLQGAFRFTTALAAKVRPRDVSIRVKNVTAGIRGTDLWGKSTEARDLVCLLEGAITVGSEGYPTVTLDKPNDFYQRPRDGAPAVAQVDAAQVASWSSETALEGEGQSADGKGWHVVVATLRSRDEALQLARQLRGAGFAAELASAPPLHYVRLTGFATEPQARAVMGNLRGLPGVELPKVVRTP